MDPAESPLTPEVVRAALALPSPLPAIPPPASARPAAVVVPVRLDEAPRALCVFRSRALREHPGEVAFPGGKCDRDDASLEATALRELREELAVSPGEVTLLGALTPIPVITGRYLIHPFVAALDPRARPRVASAETERIAELPLLAWLEGGRRHGAVASSFGDAPILLPHFEVEDRILYGASAFIFFELISRLARFRGRELAPPVVTNELPWAGRYREP
ncbi:MAG: CoA pyrophosphatase [Sorangiineae bacterium]|nr:CoA pyrophosphatase [Sorangiineae bacterium]MEB2343286.1 CoA pyrophosphatase [Deltaproteobacteria bacterium]